MPRKIGFEILIFPRARALSLPSSSRVLALSPFHPSPRASFLPLILTGPLSLPPSPHFVPFRVRWPFRRRSSKDSIREGTRSTTPELNTDVAIVEGGGREGANDTAVTLA